MQNRILTTPQQLIADLEGDEPPVLLDVRFRLGQPPLVEEYRAGHIPGAHYLDTETVFSGPPGAAGRHPLPDPAALAAGLRGAGVDADTPVVVYDAADSMAAARAWWVLRYFGHPDVRVLDGGLRGWREAGLPEETGDPEPAEGGFTPEPGHLPLLATPEQAAEAARAGLLFDARSPERFRGEVEPVDPVAGHIPGAHSLPTADNMLPDGRYRPSAELAERFAAAGAVGSAPVGVYCGSGISAAQQVLAMHQAGFPAALYVGSWSEWTGDPSRPVATGRG